MERERRVIKMQQHIHDAIHRSTVIYVLERHLMPVIQYGLMFGRNMDLLAAISVIFIFSTIRMTHS